MPTPSKKNEHAASLQRFIDEIPNRIEALTHVVNASSGYEDWIPSETESSLAKLAEWFASQVRTRPRTASEKEGIRSKLAFDMEIPDRELTDDTAVVATDVGLYISRVLQKKFPHVHWKQEAAKRDVDYGQPVLVGFGKATLNPMRIMITFAYGIAASTSRPERLLEIVRYWSEQAASHLNK